MAQDVPDASLIFNGGWSMEDRLLLSTIGRSNLTQAAAEISGNHARPARGHRSGWGVDRPATRFAHPLARPSHRRGLAHGQALVLARQYLLVCAGVERGGGAL